MRRFRFRLEKVLQLRQHREQEAKIELGMAISILAEIENKIKHNELLRAQSSQQRFSGIAAAEGGAGAIASGAVSMFAWDAYILRLEQEAERLMEEAAQAELVVEEKRAQYVEASRELKVMEKLKERRAAEHRKEMFVAQTKELDDLRREKAAD